MAESYQRPLTTGKKSRTTSNRQLAMLSRWLHIYLSMVSFGIVIFFAVTGLTLNHAEIFGNKLHTIQEKGKLEGNWVKTSDTTKVAKLEIVEWLRKAHGIKAAVTDFRIDESEIAVSFKGPGYAADVFINRATGEYDVSETSAGLVGILNDLHKGRDTGSQWSVVIDISAILLISVSLTGIILLLFIKRKRLNGLIFVAIGLLIIYLMYTFL